MTRSVPFQSGRKRLLEANGKVPHAHARWETALATAALTPTLPSSPKPLTPSGLIQSSAGRRTEPAAEDCAHVISSRRSVGRQPAAPRLGSGVFDRPPDKIGSPSGAAKQRAKLSFRGFERSLAFGRQVSPGPVDVEGQHRHRGPKRARLPAIARLGGALERPGDLAGAVLFERVRLEIERVRILRDLRRPLFLRAPLSHSLLLGRAADLECAGDLAQRCPRGPVHPPVSRQFQSFRSPGGTPGRRLGATGYSGAAFSATAWCGPSPARS